MMALSADFGLAYEAKKRNAGTQRDASLAMNAYSKFLSQQRGSRGLIDLNTSMTKGLQGLSSGMSKRGLGYSGIYQQAQSEYGQDWLQKQTDITDTMTQEGRSLDLQDAKTWADYSGVVGDAELDKQSQIAADAARLEAMKPFL